MYKLTNKQSPDYLCDLMPLLAMDRTNYNLRNANHISIPKTNHIKTYNSFIPQTTRDWNSVAGFKTMYKSISEGPTQFITLTIMVVTST